MTIDDGQVGDLVREADRLAAAIEKLNADLAEAVVALGKIVQRDRRRVRILIASVIFDLVLSVAVGFFAVTAVSAKGQSEENRNTSRIACQAGNDARAGQIQLWDYVLSVSSNKGQTAEEKARAEAFRSYVKNLFKPRDCDPTS